MQMLKRIRLKGWKSIRDQSITLGPLTVLIGANGSGKSNLLSLVEMLADTFCTEPRMRSYVSANGTATNLLHYGDRETKSIDIELTFETSNSELKYATKWIPTLDGGLIFEDERIEVLHDNSSISQVINLGSGHAETNLVGSADRGNSIARTCLCLLRGCKVFQFHDTSLRGAMRCPSRVDANRFLLSKADNLASMLYRYKQNNPITYRQISVVSQRIISEFEQFILEPSRLDDTEIVLQWKQKNREYEFGPHQFPDGALRFIALSALLLQPEKELPNLIGLDEPELGLHPLALELLSDMAIVASLNSQVILATQSSRLLDYFEPTSVLVADRNDGATEFNNLDVERLNIWFEKYSLGELWERNYLGGGPDS